MTAGTLWWIRNSAEAAQGVLQVAIFVAFIPTFKNAYLFPDLESWIPWLLWTLCFVAQFYSVKYSNPKNYIQYLYPVCGTVWHMIVFGLTLR